MVKIRSLTINIGEAPSCIRESIRTTLRAHGIELAEPIMRELGNNTAQALYNLSTEY